MIDPSRDQLDSRQQELWDQGGAVAALVNLAQTIRNTTVHVAGAIDSVALELDRERRGDLSTMQRGCNVTVRETVLRLLDEPMLLQEERDDLCAQVLTVLQEANQ